MLWAASLPQFAKMSQEVMCHLRRSSCKEVIDIDATQGNYIMRQILRCKTELVSKRLLEQSRLLGDEAKRFMNLREKNAIRFPLRGKGHVNDSLSPFLRPKLRSFAKTIDGLMNKPGMAWRKKLKLVKNSGWTEPGKRSAPTKN